MWLLATIFDSTKLELLVLPAHCSLSFTARLFLSKRTQSSLSIFNSSNFCPTLEFPVSNVTITVVLDGARPWSLICCLHLQGSFYCMSLSISFESDIILETSWCSDHNDILIVGKNWNSSIWLHTTRLAICGFQENVWNKETGLPRQGTQCSLLSSAKQNKQTFTLQWFWLKSPTSSLLPHAIPVLSFQK